MRATEKGKDFAQAALGERREHYADVKLPDNASLPAGSPMYFRCLGCGAPLVEPEGYISKPDTCDECAALLALGWMT